MGLSYKQSSVPASLNEGEFAVVDGVTYVGNSSNEPVPSRGYLVLRGTISITSDGAGDVAVTKTLQDDDLSLSPTWVYDPDNFSSGIFSETSFAELSNYTVTKFTLLTFDTAFEKIYSVSFTNEALSANDLAFQIHKTIGDSPTNVNIGSTSLDIEFYFEIKLIP